MAGLDDAEGGGDVAFGEADDRTPGDRPVRMAGLDAAEGGDDVAIGRAAAAVDGGEDAPGLDDPCFLTLIEVSKRPGGDGEAELPAQDEPTEPSIAPLGSGGD